VFDAVRGGNADELREELETCCCRCCFTRA